MSEGRLSREMLDALPSSVKRPGYDVRSKTARWVHIGAGAFHRAHQAVYAQRLMQQGEAGWGIIAASLRSGAVPESLAAQDHLYSLVTQTGGADGVEIIGSLKDVIFAKARLKDLIAAIASPDTALVTITVTEKGYGVDRSTGTLQAERADIARDLDSPEAPETLPGVLVAGLAERVRQGGAPLTILSCDNLPHNGAATRACVTGFAERTDPALAAWISRSVSFPSSMVDRIVPATTGEDRDKLASATGYRDEALVKAEPFSQWVVEDNFAGARPPLDTVGVQFTSDVAPWETAKLRLLNGAHSSMAWLGGLAGETYVHEFVARAGNRSFVQQLWDESEETLLPADGLDVRLYRGELMKRFANPGLAHRLFQIAMDGSQKLPQRLLAPFAERAGQGRKSPALSLGIAAWMRWQAGRTDEGESFEVDDPLAGELRALAEQAGPEAADIVATFASFSPVFGDALRDRPERQAEITQSLSDLQRLGAHEAMARCAMRAPRL